MAETNDKKERTGENAVVRSNTKKPVYKKVWFWIVIAVILIFLIGSCSGGKGGTQGSQDAAVESITAAYNGHTNAGTVVNSDSDFEVYTVDSNGSKKEVDGWSVAKEKTIKAGKTTKVTIEYEGMSTVVEIAGDVPIEWENALAKAQTYSDTMYMSKQGIYRQLTSEVEGFDDDAAQYAIDNVEADWNANALAKAQDYQETMHMSKDAIYKQLTSKYGERFTKSQAQYAIDNL